MLHMCHKCIRTQTMWQSGLAALVDQTTGILQSALEKGTQLRKAKPETHAKFLLWFYSCEKHLVSHIQTQYG